MAKVTRVSVSYGLTINLGDYNNVKPEVTIEAVLEKNDDEHEVTQDLFAQAKNEVAAMLQEQCAVSVAKIPLFNANNLDDVEKLFARQSVLFRYIQNLDHKRAVEAIAYPLWNQEEERRAEVTAQQKSGDYFGKRLEGMGLKPAPTPIKPGARPGVHPATGLSSHDPIADIDDVGDGHPDDYGDR